MTTAVLVQTSTAGLYGGTSLTATATLNGVTAGNTLIALVGHQDFGNNNYTMAVSDAQGSYSPDAYLIRSSNGRPSAGVFSLFTANAGTHACSAVASLGTVGNSFGALVLQEWSGLSALDQAASNSAGGTTTPTSGTTATLAQNNDVIFTILSSNSTQAGGTFPPTGGPGTYTQVFNSTLVDQDYQIIQSSTAAVSASWGTLTAAANWAAVIATYTALPAAASTPQPIFYQRRTLYFI
jgi:hypothetical protein